MNILYGLSNANHDVVIGIIYNTEVLISNICDYNNVYILVRSDITDIGHQSTQVAFNKCTPLNKCITKPDGRWKNNR